MSIFLITSLFKLYLIVQSYLGTLKILESLNEYPELNKQFGWFYGKDFIALGVSTVTCVLLHIIL